MTQYLGKKTQRLWAHPRFNLEYYLTERNIRKEEEEREQLKHAYSKYQEPGTRFITKTPSDTLRARLIQEYFPDAYFVAIVRNGYAVSEGIRRKREFDPDRPEYAGLKTSIDAAADQWFRANVIVISHKDFLRKYKIIKYEDLVKDTNKTLDSILDFLKLGKDGFPYPTFEPNKNIEQIKRLTDAEKKKIEKIAGPMLKHFDYHDEVFDQIFKSKLKEYFGL